MDWQQAASAFDPVSVAWDNGGPLIRLSNNNTTASAFPEHSRRTGWKQARGNTVLQASPQGSRFEFTLQMDSLVHKEIVLGVVDPSSAPQTPSCLHSAKSDEGVFIHFFGFDQIAEGDFITALINLDEMKLTFARNGAMMQEIPAITIPSTVVPVVELYGHDHPSITIVPLPFLD